jgi:hypothetical protein
MASGTVFYQVKPNSTASMRVGSIGIGGQTLQLAQEGLDCSVTINTAALATPFAVNGGARVIGITANGPNCQWSASSNVTWASVTPVSGAGDGSIGLTVQSNEASSTLRNGSITIAGQTINFSQAGTSCTFALQSSSGSVPAAGGAGSVGVIAAAACNWPPSASNDPWLSIESLGGAGTGDLKFNAAPNSSALERTGSLTIAGVTYNVTQAGAPCAFQFAFPSLAFGV